MADSLPVTIQMGALPEAVRWTPQQLADAMVARMRLVTAQTFALFVSGSTEPGSNVGPWLKNGSSWYVWSDTAGAYVPITVEPESLGYWIGPDQPDNAVYNFWIETAVGGSPLALKIYHSGAWVDVYATTLSAYLTIATAALTYAPIASPTFTGTPAAPTAAPGTNTTQLATTAFVAALGALKADLASPTFTGTPAVPTAAPGTNTTQAASTAFVAASYAPLASPALTGTPTVPTAAPATNTTQAASTAFVTAAIAAIPGVTIVAGQGIFRGDSAATQNVVFGGAGNMTGDITLGTETFDPDGCFAANTFTAPATGYYSFKAEVSTAITGGAPTAINVIAQFAVNGTPGDALNDEETSGTAGQTIVGSTDLYLTAGNTVKLTYDFTSNAAVTIQILGARLSGYRIR